jgi:hypothetical protein
MGAALAAPPPIHKSLEINPAAKPRSNPILPKQPVILSEA